MGDRILVLSDDHRTSASLGETLPAFIHTTPRDGLEERLDVGSFHVVLADSCDGPTDLELCFRVHALAPDTPIILLMASGNMKAAIDALRAGVYDVLAGPVDRGALVVAVGRALKEHALRREVRRLRAVLDPRDGFLGMIGTSPAMKRLFGLIDRVAESQTTVLVTGESGAGKELVAKALHTRSSRRSGPFVPINCAALPEALLESELFGHVRGAFTDARAARAGLFTKATDGTLFLDEIAEMPFGVQAKLLRALQERTVRPVGGDSDVPFNARIIAATSRDLETEVRQGRFRADLHYRVEVVRIDVPPLRSRAEDIMLLAKAFLLHTQVKHGARVVGFRNAAIERLLDYAWPGNVRELRNCIERAAAVATFDHIGLEDFPERVLGKKVAIGSLDPADILSMDEVEQRYIVTVVRACRGIKAHAARVLGFDRRTLYRKLTRTGLGVDTAALTQGPPVFPAGHEIPTPSARAASGATEHATAAQQPATTLGDGVARRRSLNKPAASPLLEVDIAVLPSDGERNPNRPIAANPLLLDQSDRPPDQDGEDSVHERSTADVAIALYR